MASYTRWRSRCAAAGCGFPEQSKVLARQGGRPRLASPKVHIGLRLAADVVSGIKASGKGYNTRVEQVLREALAKGQI